jgi:hypothetical protein
MIVQLATPAPERGTYIIDASFFDEDEVSVVPNSGSLTWTLTDTLGTVVNSRLNVAITSAAIVHIVLSGLDLAIGDGLLSVQRKVLIVGTYNSSLGSNLPIRQEIEFSIDDHTYPSGIT